MGNIKIVLGLGNPGRRYQNTRHNAGFRVVEKVAEMVSVKTWRARLHGLISEADIGGERVVLVKPLTYVNRSGRCAQAVCQDYAVLPQGLLVVVDDMALPVGKIRIRRKGSSGNHGGLNSIIECLNTSDFPRLRIGIGKTEGDAAEYVLGQFTREEEKILQELFERATRAVISWVQEGIEASMNEYN